MCGCARARACPRVCVYVRFCSRWGRCVDDGAQCCCHVLSPFFGCSVRGLWPRRDKTVPKRGPFLGPLYGPDFGPDPCTHIVHARLIYGMKAFACCSCACVRASAPASARARGRARVRVCQRRRARATGWVQFAAPNVLNVPRLVCYILWRGNIRLRARVGRTFGILRLQFLVHPPQVFFEKDGPIFGVRNRPKIWAEK